MKSYQIHLIRQGITDANSNGQYIGTTDLPLSQQGIDQLATFSKEYDYPGAAVFYTSPLKRCVQTCQILYPQVTPIAVQGLAECNFGEWEGKTAKQLANDALFQQWLENSQSIAPPGGESNLQFAHRVCDTFEKLVEGMMKIGTTEAVIVTHGGVIMTILTAYGLPRAQFYDWMVDSGCGYSIRINPSLWMRGQVAEVYARLPGGLQQNTQPLAIAREAANRAYGKGE